MHHTVCPFVVVHISQAFSASHTLNDVLVRALVSSSSVKGMPYVEPLTCPFIWPVMWPFVTVCTSFSGFSVALSDVFGRRSSSLVCCLERPTAARQRVAGFRFHGWCLPFVTSSSPTADSTTVVPVPAWFCCPLLGPKLSLLRKLPRRLGNLDPNGLYWLCSLFLLPKALEKL